MYLFLEQLDFYFSISLADHEATMSVPGLFIHLHSQIYFLMLYIFLNHEAPK